MQRARELAARSPLREVAGTHLLFALCQERTTAAYRAIAQCGSDVTKLRTAAMQLAMGIIGPRRTTSTQLALPPSPLSTPRVAARPAAPVAAPQPPPKPVVLTAASPPSEAPTAGPRPRRPRGRRSRASSSTPRRCPPSPRWATTSPWPPPAGSSTPSSGARPRSTRTLDVLAKRQANCPCLVGPSGVGKTSVVRGLAAADRQRTGRGAPRRQDPRRGRCRGAARGDRHARVARRTNGAYQDLVRASRGAHRPLIRRAALAAGGRRRGGLGASLRPRPRRARASARRRPRTTSGSSRRTPPSRAG